MRSTFEVAIPKKGNALFHEESFGVSRTKSDQNRVFGHPEFGARRSSDPRDAHRSSPYARCNTLGSNTRDLSAAEYAVAQLTWVSYEVFLIGRLQLQ
jgi:hypothetical protein